MKQAFISIISIFFLSGHIASASQLNGTWEADLGQSVNEMIQITWTINGQDLTTDSICYPSSKNEMRAAAQSKVYVIENVIFVTQSEYKYTIGTDGHSCSTGFGKPVSFKILKLDDKTLSIEATNHDGSASELGFSRIK